MTSSKKKAIKIALMWGVVLAVLCVLLAYTPAADATETTESTRDGIFQNMQANLEACTYEDMDKLLACMSEEMPNRELFIDTVENAWEMTDTYNTVVDVKVLKRSQSRWAQFKYPYATALITQRTVNVRQTENIRSQWADTCQDGKCTEDELARMMALTDRDETIEFEALFKHENGQWKLIANITRPKIVVEAGESAQTSSRANKRGRSVF